MGALAILGRLEDVDADRTGRWLAERQCDSGGLNGEFLARNSCYIFYMLFLRYFNLEDILEGIVHIMPRITVC